MPLPREYAIALIYSIRFSVFRAAGAGSACDRIQAHLAAQELGHGTVGEAASRGWPRSTAPRRPTRASATTGVPLRQSRWGQLANLHSLATRNDANARLALTQRYSPTRAFVVRVSSSPQTTRHQELPYLGLAETRRNEGKLAARVATRVVSAADMRSSSQSLRARVVPGQGRLHKRLASALGTGELKRVQPGTKVCLSRMAFAGGFVADSPKLANKAPERAVDDS